MGKTLLNGAVSSTKAAVVASCNGIARFKFLFEGPDWEMLTDVFVEPRGFYKIARERIEYEYPG